ncbi:related to polypeptide chain release factors [Ramularia collo-cygni]|uniref:Related to polypeptide chain release factors n=1 Tax=Ramularia collo-cygni TaxID=112498 RepID=A0A2D3VHF8_9PEZI|nr:related to polypeptide chain release factors [Ramularia collo-cygni]CZT23651.1 related to polypeptide chain release factors [Ramularia collo-cygni]
MSVKRLCSNVAIVAKQNSFVRNFSVFHAHFEKPLPPRMVIPETDLIESFLKGSGPGGQKINKTSSAVQLKHIPTGIVVKSQETRSREQNRRTARRILGEKLEDIEKGPQSRTAIKTERARKKKASADKKARRKYRKLEEGKAADGEEDQRDPDGLGESDGIAEEESIQHLKPEQVNVKEVRE